MSIYLISGQQLGNSNSAQLKVVSNYEYFHSTTQEKTHLNNIQ